MNITAQSSAALIAAIGHHHGDPKLTTQLLDDLLAAGEAAGVDRIIFEINAKAFVITRSDTGEIEWSPVQDVTEASKDADDKKTKRAKGTHGFSFFVRPINRR